ncbi:MAG: Ni/Fe hydrogenase subunit alpha [Acidimicrobiales bacterium]|jgi:coenzyme F420-reducing hydrogenase alpha subunit
MTHRSNGSRDVQVDALARVEGEGALHVAVRDGIVTDVALNIFEPPRFFEALLRGRRHTEAPDITARICGICPVAYQMSACAAMEDACGVSVDPGIEALRRLLYCGEYIQSHALHVYLLHAPDFFNCEDAVQLAGLDQSAVERGLALKRTGNLLMEAVGGRAVHPVNVRVGGFYRAPDPAAIRALAEPLRRARDAALVTVEWVAGFDFPDVERDYVFVSLRRPDCYPLESGRVASSEGLDTTPAGFAEIAVEEHVQRSNALHAKLGGTQEYLTGPLARYALNFDVLPEIAREAAAAAGLGPVCRNPFRSIVVRAVETVFACDEALRLVESYEPPEPPATEVPGVAGVGTGATEAPRGLLLHRYELDAEGIIRSARIMPPTSQNQLSIESDVRRVVESSLSLSDEQLTWRCEQTVRNYDPCISCATHFLDVTVERHS